MATREEVQKLAALARLSIPEDKLDAFASGFDSILAYVGKLDELSLPVGVGQSRPTVRNVFREDGEPHAPGAYTDALVAQFPEKESNALKVKQIIVHD